MHKVSKRILAVGLPLAVVAASGAAFAYWTGGGAGDVTAKANGTISGLTLSSPTVPSMVPGQTVDLDVDAANANATTSISVATLTGSVKSSTDLCDAVLAQDGAGVLVTPQLSASPAIVAPHSTGTKIGTVAVTFANSPTINQSDCKGATFTVSLTAG